MHQLVDNARLEVCGHIPPGEQGTVETGITLEKFESKSPSGHCPWLLLLASSR